MMQQERRRYFRINDVMGVSYRQLGAEEARAFARQSSEHGSQFDFSANFDNRIQTLLGACKIQSPVAAELIDLMNKKLNFVIQQMDVDSGLMHKAAFVLRDVNVSACGIAFVSDDVYQRGEFLQLDLELQPSQLHVVALARVVECKVVTAGNTEDESSQLPAPPVYYLRLDFSEINANDQELLIQHIVKRQSAGLRHRHEKNQSVPE